MATEATMTIVATTSDRLLPHDMSALRRLRLWHWEQYRRWEALAKKHEGSRRGPQVLTQQKVRQYRRLATTHIHAVQALNDLFPVSDTVVDHA